MSLRYLSASYGHSPSATTARRRAPLGFRKFPLDIITQDESAEPEQRFAATVSAFWTEMTFAFLRAHYFADCGKEEGIKAALTSEPLNRISEKVQTD